MDFTGAVIKIGTSGQNQVIPMSVFCTPIHRVLKNQFSNGGVRQLCTAKHFQVKGFYRANFALFLKLTSRTIIHNQVVCLR